MSDAARKILQDVLALPEDEQLELASEIIGECQSSCRFLLIPYKVARDSAPSMVS